MDSEKYLISTINFEKEYHEELNDEGCKEFMGKEFAPD